MSVISKYSNFKYFIRHTSIYNYFKLKNINFLDTLTCTSETLIFKAILLRRIQIRGVHNILYFRSSLSLLF